MKQFLLASLALVALLIPFHATAQVYRPGFIVQADGDTTKGLVRYREGKLTYQSCIFKTSEEAETKEYFPADIQAYGVVGETPFRTKVVPSGEGVSSPTFVEVVEQGKLMLYAQDDQLYLEKENSGLKHLYLQNDNHDLPMYTGERQTVMTSAQHLILIHSLTLDCPVPDKLMLKVRQRLHVPNVAAIVRNYNTCAEPASAVSYKKDKLWIQTELGVFAGSYLTALQFNHSTSAHRFSGAKLPSASNFVFGAVFNFSSPKKSERFSVQLEPMYSKEQHKGNYVFPREAYEINGDYTINISRFSLPIMLRYTLTTNGKFRPYIGAGITNDFILDSNVQGSQSTKYFANGYVHKSDYRDSEIGTNISHAVTAAVGTKFQFSERHATLLQFRYEHGRYLATDQSYTDSRVYLAKTHQGYYLTAAYLFK
ncbi:outer membrane beta-barrel protein [Pontibacter indicus]|uniref:Outer membrane protein beta-barrel domain-containing protein n=1 Tax=Pontibacter indicus TaxID=1317125 RepID=A0A1R3XI63_9BACT|nr:outer membrane beta-barrel protein [Pontibacter indicus]SIT89914.1 Outer membrane protein beta-barrel domain-containing protein [Pontibacter indicus]